MRIRLTTIREAARDRFAEWTLAVRTQDGLRSLPGSHRLTDKTSGPPRIASGQRIRVSAALQKRQHAKAGKTFPEFIVVGQFVSACRQPGATPTSLAYVSSRGSPGRELGDEANSREKTKTICGAKSRRKERTKPINY